jgi:conjugative relaxase-like TrwC/TraI family protein
VSVSFKKLKLGAGIDHTAQDIVRYSANEQGRGGDYYSEEGRAFQMWHVSARVAEEFGIGMRVHARDQARLLNGEHPVTGKASRKPGPDGTWVAAIDLCVSPAPKSVSVLWALADDALRLELETMVGQAATAAVRRMLREQPLTRKRHGRDPGEVHHEQAADYVAWSATHTTARQTATSDGVPDPQLHLHFLLIGALNDKGRLQAFDSLQIARYQARLDAEAQGELAELLRQRGFAIDRKLVQPADADARRARRGVPRVAWEIAGIPEELRLAMSSRSEEIVQLKRRYEEKYGREAWGPAWDAWVTNERRPKERHETSELRAAWRAVADEHGLGAEQLARLLAEVAERRALVEHTRSLDGRDASEAAELIEQYVNAEHAFVSRADLDKIAHQLAIGLVGPVELELVLARMLRRGELLVLGEGDDYDVTTVPIVALEKRTIGAAHELVSGRSLAPLPTARVDEELARLEASGQALDAEQAQAVRLVASGRRFVSITGPAGTGKGYASRTMTTLLNEAGRRVIALAVPGRTAQQAQADSGADDGMTLDALVHRARDGRLDLSERDVLLVDEAGMIDHERYAPFLEAAVRSGASVVQVGDDRQLPPVGPGGLRRVTHRIARRAGATVELVTIHRTRDPEEARAWTWIRHGHVMAGLGQIGASGRLRLHETREQLREAMVADWWEAGPPRGIMIVDTSNRERDELNRLAQEKRLEAGELGGKAVRIADRELHVGDLVIFRSPYKPAMGAESDRWMRRVENGTLASVTAIDEKHQRATVELLEPTVRSMEIDERAPVELGYARHVMKAQGVTRETADIALSQRTNLNSLYVMVTRAREGARVHGVVAEVREAVARAEGTDRDAADVEAEEAEQREAELEDPFGSPSPATRPAEAQQQASHETEDQVREPQAPPPGSTPVSEFQAQLVEAQRTQQAERDEREAAITEATLRKVEATARDATKYASVDRAIREAEAWEARDRAERDDHLSAAERRAVQEVRGEAVPGYQAPAGTLPAEARALAEIRAERAAQAAQRREAAEPAIAAARVADRAETQAAERDHAVRWEAAPDRGPEKPQEARNEVEATQEPQADAGRADAEAHATEEVVRTSARAASEKREREASAGAEQRAAREAQAER